MSPKKRKKLFLILTCVIVAVLTVGTWAFFHWFSFMLRKPMTANGSYNLSMTVVAGDGTAGFLDGTSPQFNKPIRLAPFGKDAIIVADINNHAIRIVHLDGRTETLAGGPAKQGYLDGLASQARFDSPHGVAVRNDGVIAVAEAANNTIRLLVPNDRNDIELSTHYSVTTLAGQAGKKGFKDGPVADSLFNAPHSVAWGKNNELYVADIGNARLRKINNGEVTTIAGTGSFGHEDGPLEIGSLQYPMDLTIDSNGNILIADAGTGLIRQYTPTTGLSTPYPTLRLDMPHGLAATPDGHVIVAEMNAHRIVLLAPDNKIIHLCGTGKPGSNQNQLRKPASVILHSGYLWIADLKNHRIVITKWQQGKGQHKDTPEDNKDIKQESVCKTL